MYAVVKKAATNTNLHHRSHFTLTLTGTLTSALGPTPLIKVTASLNGTLGPSVTDKLCNHRLEITQNEAHKCPPEKGPVEMSYSVMIPYPWLKKGYYTVRTEMFTTKGEKMTDFEGTVWVDGEVGGDDGWV